MEIMRKIIALGVVIWGLICAVWGRSLSYPKLVFAHYYTWYGTPQMRGEWAHWDFAGHNPERLLPSGLPDTGTTNHPYKLYDSHDPALIKHHLELAEYAGIDVFIATWWNIGDDKDVAFQRLLKVIQETGSPVRATIYFEQAKDGKEGVLRDLGYVAEKYFESPAFFKIGGSPVVFIYGRGLMQTPLEDWREVLATFREKYNAIFIGDSLWGDYVGIFDGIHTYNPVIFIKRGDDIERLYKKLVLSAQLQGKISVATVIPGYNDSNIGRRNPIIVPRDQGLSRAWSTETFILS